MAAGNVGSTTDAWLAGPDAEKEAGLARTIQPGPGRRHAAAI
jgi:hypothetical protein